jgi:hypothetical protein
MRVQTRTLHGLHFPARLFAEVRRNALTARAGRLQSLPAYSCLDQEGLGAAMSVD